MRHLITLLLLVLQAVTGRGQSTDIHGAWTAELRAGKVFLQVRTAPPPDWDRSGSWNGGGWNMGQTFPVDELAGLPANDDQLTAASVKFDLRREAGTLAFEGSFRDGRGAGLFTFAPRPAFAGEMRGLGYTDALPLWRQYQLAVHDVGPKYIGALKTEGYDKLTAEELVRARDHGVSAEYVADMKGLGLKDLTLAQIVRLRDHGITPGFVNHAHARGFKTTDPEELIRLKNGGLWKK